MFSSNSMNSDEKFEQFKKKVKILNTDEALEIRNEYIDVFINKESKCYQEYIMKKQKWKDGSYYSCYLWDCLIEYNKASRQFVLYHKYCEENVYVFWDIHSAHRVFDRKRYWRFERDSVLCLNYQDLLENLEFLPEDLYICNEIVTWTIIFTHEYRGKKDNIKYMAGDFN